MKKNYEIQSIRGIAALMVFFSHAFGSMHNPIYICGINLNETPFRILWGGECAVVVFFFLSGYFTWHSIKELNLNIYLNYLVKRLVRLYPVFIITLIIATLLCNLGLKFNNNYFSEWFSSFWNEKITILEFLKQSTIIFNNNFNLINPVAWTLKYEIIMAFVMPIIIVFLREYKSIVIYIIAVMISLTLGSFSYLHIFVIGAILAKHEDNIINNLKIKKYQIYTILILGIIMIGFRYNFISLSYKIPYTILMIILSFGWVLFFLMIKLLNSSGIGIKVLKNKGFKFYGDISYSFYLIHFIVLLSLRGIMGIIKNNYIYIFIALLVSTIFAYIFNKVIEKKLSNSIYRLLKI